MTKITTDEVKKLAALAKLAITDEDAQKYQTEFDSILEFVSQLNAVDTEDVMPTTQVTGLHNVTRQDEITKSDANKAELLDGAPSSQDGYVKVNRVIE